jgi:hypothetical protein
VRVITALFAATARHRHPVVAIALVLAVGHAAARWWWPWTFAMSVALVVVLAVLMIVGWSQPAVRTLTARPERQAFEAPAAAAPVYAALCFLTVATGQLGSLLRDVRSDRLPAFDVMWTLLWLLVAARWLVLAWAGSGVRPTPDGIRSRDVFGTLRVPWVALDRGVPPVADRGRRSVVLTYARPELVRRSGPVLSRRVLRADPVDASVLAEVLRHYLAHPEARPAIGTLAELSRLLRSLS